LSPKRLIAVLLTPALLLVLYLVAISLHPLGPADSSQKEEGTGAVLILTFDTENPYNENMYQPIGYTDTETTPPSALTVPKILELLGEKDVKGTFFLVGWTADNYLDLVQTLLESGNEIAVHGYTHAPILTISQSQREEELEKSLEAVERHQMSLGFRSPFMQVDDALLDDLSALGFTYDSSYDRYYYPGKRPFRSGSIVELPVDRPIDWEVYESHKLTGAHPFPEGTWLSYRKERLDNAVEEGDVIVQLHHPWVIAKNEKRLQDLAEFLDYAKGYEAEGKLEILTCQEYVDRYW